MGVVTITLASGYDQAIRSVLLAANRGVDDRSVALAAGVVGVTGLTAFCSVDCSCADTVLAQGRLLAALPSLGLRAHPAPSVGDEPVYRIISTSSRPARRTGIMRGLLQSASDMFCPPLPWRCRSSGAGMAGTGLAAYGLWLDALERCVRISARRKDGLLRRSQSWAELRMMGARFCSGVAGKRRSEWARSLRDVSRRMESESAMLRQVSSALPGRRPIASVTAAIAQAHREALQWAPVLCDAALTLAGIEQPIRGELCADGDTVPNTVCLPDLVYLARAGSVPFRILALRRLARSQDAQAQATVRESVHDLSDQVAGTARWFMDGQAGQSVR